jgi:hypothetical protein
LAGCVSLASEQSAWLREGQQFADEMTTAYLGVKGGAAGMTSKADAPGWPGQGRTRGEAGDVDASAFRAVAERLLALPEADVPERQVLDFLAALCRAHADDVMDARAQSFMRRPFAP